MKSILLLLIITLSVNAYSQSETMTNKSIIEMMGMGFSDDIIIAKIKEGKGDFSTSIEELKDLKDKGVSDAIIVEIMGKKSKTENDDKIGIFTKANGNLIKILPTVFSGTKTNTLAAAFTYGIADATIKSSLAGATSRNIIQSSKPDFFFYFAKAQNNSFSIGASNWLFSSATSPNEFSLVKLNSKKNKRELNIGKVNIYAGNNIGVSEEQTIKFSITQIDDFVFGVKPSGQLEAGEYCFFYQGVIPQGGYSNQAVFDFSIPEECGVVSKYRVDDTVWTINNDKPKSYKITDVKFEEDGVHYVGVGGSSWKEYDIPESKCYASKKELIKAIQDEK